MIYSDLIFAAVLLPFSVLALFFDRSAEYKNLILCVVSFLFIVWGRPISAALVLCTFVVDFLLALLIEKTLDTRGERPALAFLFLDLIWNVMIFLICCRSSIFPEDSFLHISSAKLPIIASFYTLKNFSYVYDVYSGNVKAERNPFCLLTYSMAYPFLLAGPVVRYRDIEPQLRSRTLDVTKLSRGITLYSVGLAKTVIVVPILTALAETGLSREEPTLLGAWIGMICFFGSAYFTFGSLADMGAGIANMNGFDVEPNYTRITVKHALGGLVKSYNTSMVTLASDIRGDSGVFAAVMTVLLTLAGAAFYTDKRFIFLFALVIGILLAAEKFYGYDRIESVPYLLRLVCTFAAAMLLFSPFAFDSFTEWKSWLAHALGRGDLYKLSVPLKDLLLHNCYVLAVAFIYVTPLGSFISKLLDKIASSSIGAYGRVRLLKTICTAVLLALSYILLAASMLS